METLDIFQIQEMEKASPSLIGKAINQEGQTVLFYVAEEFSPCIIAHIDYAWCDTGFFDLSDMTEEHGEYTPILDKLGHIQCAFEFYNYGECPSLLPNPKSLLS